MTLDQRALLRQLDQIDAQLAADTRQALKRKVDAAIQERLRATLDNFHEAVQSKQQRKISGATRRIRTAVQETLASSQGRISMKSTQAVQRESVDWPPAIPTREYLLAFERGAGQRLEQMNQKDVTRINFTVASMTQQRSPSALFSAVSRIMLGSPATAKGRKLCILIRDGKPLEEARRIVESIEQANEVSREYLFAFQKSAGRRLEEMTTIDVKPITFTVNSVTKKRSPGALFTSVSVRILGERAQTKGRQLCIYIRDGKSEDEAKRLVEEEEKAGEVNASYLLAFEKGAGQKLEEMDSKGTERVTFTVSSVTQQRSPSSLFQAVADRFLRNAGPAKAKHFCIHIRDGKSEDEAKRLVEEEEKAGEVNASYLLAFEKGAGQKLEEMDCKAVRRVTFAIGNIEQQRGPGALFTSVSVRILGERAQTKGRQLCIYIRDGKSEDEAKRLVEEEVVQEAQESEINADYLHAFEKGAKHRLEEMAPMDVTTIIFSVSNNRKQRSPKALFSSISRKIFQSAAPAKGRQLCIYIRDGKSEDEAKRLVEEKEKAGEVNASYLLAFEKGAGQKLEEMVLEDRNMVTFYIGSVALQRNPNALFLAMATRYFANTAPAKGKQLCICIRDGKTPEEAKRIVELGEEGIADIESEKLSQMNLEEVIAFFRGQEGGAMKLKIYLQYAYSEMSEEEINRIVIRSFKNLYGGASMTKEQEYLEWEEKLPPVVMCGGPLPEETKEKTVVLRGQAQGADCVHVCGTWTRRVRVQPDGAFQVTIPLKIGEENEIRVMGINREQKLRTEQEYFVIRQSSKADDIQKLFQLLQEMSANLEQQIQVDPGRREYLAECTERVLIKKFSKSFEDGEAYTRQLLRGMKRGVVHQTIAHVLEQFRWIDGMQLPNIQEGSEMFFQKYCAMKMRQAMDQGKPGINLCNDPGLGKTRTVWAAIGDRRAVIFTPNAVMSTWKTEAHACLEHPDLLMLDDESHGKRKEKLKTRTQHHVVTNTQFLQNIEDAERFRLISDERGVAVFDEAHSRKNEHSAQSKGARKVKHRFTINVTATLARNPVELRRMLHTLDPEKPEFKNDAVFRKAFPANDPAALKSLKLIVDQHTIRFRKHEVLEEINPQEPLEQQLHRLPHKERIAPEEIGKFEMSERQAQAIYELFMNWPAWCRTYGRYIPKDEVNKEDGLWTSNGLAKAHAYRQIINNPTFINDNKGEDCKAWQLERAVKHALRQGRKVVIFCKYEKQALKYAELFKKYRPASYTGETSKLKTVKDPRTGKPLRFSVDHEGHYFQDPNGEPMSMLDAECQRFQNDANCKMLIVTYGAGSVGTTFTAGKATIYDDLPSDCKEDIQAEDRTHRIDPKRQTHASVRYYQMQARYPSRFLERMKKTWVRKQTDEDGHALPLWEEFRGKGKPPEKKPDRPWITAYEAFFEQGTYDQVHSENLRNQRLMFHLINDGIGDESQVSQGQQPFFGLEQ